MISFHHFLEEVLEVEVLEERKMDLEKVQI